MEGGILAAAGRLEFFPAGAAVYVKAESDGAVEGEPEEVGELDGKVGAGREEEALRKGKIGMRDDQEVLDIHDG